MGLVDGEPAAAPLVPQVVDVAVGDRGETPEALVAADLVLAPEDFLGGGPPGELSVGFVDLGEQSDVGGRVAAPEGPCGGLCAAVADRPDAAVPGDEAGDLGPREAGRRFEEAFDGALVGLAEAGVEDPLQGVGDQGIRPVTVEGGGDLGQRGTLNEGAHLFGDAILDRVLNNAHRITLKGAAP